MLPFQPLTGATLNDLINGLLQLQPLPHWCPLNLQPKEVYITPFFEGYPLPTFVSYRGCTDPFKYLRRSKCNCEIK